ncbi:MAG: DUF2147 domain-containing protein [Bradyrhizobium sp.]|jgi:uncharacterized protein (DUF2147 family)|uniref:DUF2147 domain-containing protein n=1 Tax=Bradyrhizobium sp. TaxID=376 RepID=UPI00121629FF|nr:DUF2147 domain-containing protein [Bradyrhizobium sp.]THD46512.1 MAG: DUF2147 domain-containing protein [Bradyrhizobium sp.]
MKAILRMILRIAVAAALAAAVCRAVVASPVDPSGTWVIEDGRARVRLERCGPTLERVCGYIVWMKEPADARGQPYRDGNNPDQGKRLRFLLGHQLIMGLKPTPEGRFEGQIYNAENGKSYSVALWRESSDRLTLKGCMLALLCSTQMWRQSNDVLPGQLVGLTGDPNGPRADQEWAAPPSPKQAAAKAR